MMDTYDPTGNSLALSQLYVLWRTLGHLRNHSKYREVRNLADGLIAAMPMLIASVARREGASDEANLALSEVVFSGSTDMLPTED